MAVRKRGGRWYYDFMIKRTRYRGVIPEARTKAQAERAESQAREEVYKGRYGQASQAPTLKSFIGEVYLPWAKAHKRSWRSDVEHAEVLDAYFGDRRLDEIALIDVERFQKERIESVTRRGKTRAPASVNRELEVLSKIFNLAIDHGVIDVNPCRKVGKLRQDNNRNRYLSADEEVRLLAQLVGRRAHLKPIVVVAINTGLRRGELLGLEWRNVDFGRNLIYVDRAHSKTGRDRHVPMNSAARGELLGLRAGAKGSGVFTNPRTGVGLTEIKRGFAAACLDAEIEDFHFHDLRHTAATRLAEVGADAFTIKEILGHASIQTSAIYTHATDAGKRRVVEALADYGEKVCLKIVPNGKRQAG